MNNSVRRVMKRLGLAVFAVVTALLLGAPVLANGSAIKLVDELQSLRKMSCCAALSQIAYSELVYPAYISISHSDPVFNFGINGLSRFKAYKRPDCGRHCSLIIDSFGFSAEMPSSEPQFAFFFPQVTLVDKDYNVIWTSENGEAVFQAPSGHDPERLELSVDLARFPSARYILVHTGRQALLEGGDYNFYNPGVTFSVGGAFVTGGQSRGSAHVLGSPVAPDGVLDVRIDDSDPHPNRDLHPPFPMD